MPNRPPFLLKIVDGSLVLATNVTTREALCLNPGRPFRVGGPSPAPGQKWSPWKAVGDFMGFDWTAAGPAEAWWHALTIRKELQWFGQPRQAGCSQGSGRYDAWEKGLARVCLDRHGLLWLYERGHTLVGDRLILSCQGDPPTYAPSRASPPPSASAASQLTRGGVD